MSRATRRPPLPPPSASSHKPPAPLPRPSHSFGGSGEFRSSFTSSPPPGPPSFAPLPPTPSPRSTLPPPPVPSPRNRRTSATPSPHPFDDHSFLPHTTNTTFTNTATDTSTYTSQSPEVGELPDVFDQPDAPPLPALPPPCSARSSNNNSCPTLPDLPRSPLPPSLLTPTSSRRPNTPNSPHTPNSPLPRSLIGGGSSPFPPPPPNSPYGSPNVVPLPSPALPPTSLTASTFTPAPAPAPLPPLPSPRRRSPLKGGQENFSSSHGGGKKEEGEEEKEKREKMGRMRHNAAMEILTSEETYLTSLMLVREMFLKPFEEGCEDSRPMLTKAEVGLYFGSLNVIISFSKALFTQLRAAISPLVDGDSLRLSSVFTSFVAFLKVYKQYTDTYETSTQELYQRVNERPQLKKFIEEAQNKPESKGLSLFDFLIMPVQRVPRYCLLLREVIRFTPEKHEDHHALKEALGKIQNLAGEINESKRIMEQKVNFLKVQSRLGLPSGWPLAPHRVYETEMNAVIMDHFHDPFPCTLFLFNDILLLCGVVRQSLSLSRSYELKGATTTPFPVSEVPFDAMQMRERKTPRPTSKDLSGSQIKKKPKLQRKKSLIGRSSLKEAHAGQIEEEECAFQLNLPYEQSVTIVFDHLHARDQFQESLAKSLAYCASRRNRALEAESLEYKAKEQFTAVGQKKFKGTMYSQAFFGYEFVDWVEKTEGSGRERAVQIGQTFIENGVVIPCELKKSHGEFHDKGFPYRFIWESRETQLAALKDAAKKSHNKLTLHLAGYKGSPSFVRARRTITQLRTEFSDGRLNVFSSEFEEEGDYYDWLCEKRQSLGTVVPAARYFSGDHVAWATYDRIEYFLGEYPDLLTILNEIGGLQGDTIKIAIKQAQL